jgi:peptidoglycan/xylan/chitin deacetylase (PgdA/CDA1 family)
MKNSFLSSQSNDQIVAILAFHKIGQPPAHGWDSWFYIPEATFVGYLSYLYENGWQVIDLVTFLHGLVMPDVLPRRSVLLTFDDGFRSMRYVALPWLLEFRYPAVLFVPTDFIGGRNWFDAGEEPEEALCDWDDLRELDRCGVSVQSHSASHRHFSELDQAQQKEELLRSKAVLEAGLRKPITVFAYPYGDGGLDPGMQRDMLKQAGYLSACLYKGGPVRLSTADPYRLTRVPMGPDTDLQAELEQG